MIGVLKGGGRVCLSCTKHLCVRNVHRVMNGEPNMLRSTSKLMTKNGFIRDNIKSYLYLFLKDTALVCVFLYIEIFVNLKTVLWSDLLHGLLAALFLAYFYFLKSRIKNIYHDNLDSYTCESCDNVFCLTEEVKRDVVSTTPRQHFSEGNGIVVARNESWTEQTIKIKTRFHCGICGHKSSAFTHYATRSVNKKQNFLGD